jgi:HK97 gp10 family phage protein
MANSFKYESNAKMVFSVLEECKEKFLRQAGLLVTTEIKVLTPVDTGFLRNSIINIVEASKGMVTIGTKTKYAPYVEFGTSRQRAQPYFFAGFRNSKKKLELLAIATYKKVN